MATHKYTSGGVLVTQSFYDDERGLKFAESTASLEMASLYKPFLARIPKGGHILDAGCGSGRDTRNFLQMGYEVTAFDASPQMVAFASKLTGLEITQMTFDRLGFTEEFDGIWACASLLHVSKKDLPSVLTKLSRALKKGGVMYMSFKQGSDEEIRNGRHFSDFTENAARALIYDTSDLRVEESWETVDLRPGRDQEHWVNLVVSKYAGIESYIVGKIPGAAQLFEWFGYWPSFHDAEVTEVYFSRSGVSWIKVHVFRMTDVVNSLGEFVLDKHAVVTLTLHGIRQWDLSNFNHQNVIGSLSIFPSEDCFLVDLEPNFGANGTVIAERLEIEISPGKPVEGYVAI